MDASFEVSQGDRPFGAMVKVGPTPPARYPQLEVPSTSLWEVRYEALGLSLELDVAFSGERLEIQKLTARGLAGKPVQSRDLTQLGLPEVLKTIASLSIPNYEFWTQDFQDRNLVWDELKVDDEFLAQLMWVAQIGHGNARKALMDYFQIPRSTTTLIIRRLRSKYPMPTRP